MFARKIKSSDVQASIQRFTDLNRDCVSRVKHLKILLDTLTLNEKRQLIDEHSFETFHLVEELLLATDAEKSVNQLEGAIEAESGLWTLEQILCLAPELVGSGWQRHAIESLLKKAIFPRNYIAVRKIAIRLFLIYYQCRGVYGKASHELDRVFQCLLPYFPLRSGENTEDILTEYCQSAGSVDWCEKSTTSSASSAGSNMLSAKERAQMLQVYLDKFLEYCTRETVRIEWNEESRRIDCANFIIDKVIKLYMCECFDELESNGVDVFGGWEGAEEIGEPLDTADPVVIARYWLIRWINNVASASHSQPTHASLLLYQQALFSSHKATNVALTLMREAMTLPLACSNVTQKVVNVLSNWILQFEIPPFVASGEVTMERFSLLMTNMLLSFFHSPYLLQTGDRTSAAVSIAFSIFNVIKQLVAKRIQLPRPLSKRVWSELVSGVCTCALKTCTQTDAFAMAVVSGFVSTLVQTVVILKAVRRVELDDSVWDEVHSVMQCGKNPAMTEAWAYVSLGVTRALVLHLAHVDIFTKEEIQERLNGRKGKRDGKPIENGDETFRTDVGSSIGGEVAEETGFAETDDVTATVNSWSGDKTTWLLTWRRVMSLADPNGPGSTYAISAIAQSIKILISVSLHPLAHWLSCRLVTAPSECLADKETIEAMESLLDASRPPPPLLTANILLNFLRIFENSSMAQNVVPALSNLPATELSVIAPRAFDKIIPMSKLLENKGNAEIAKYNEILILFSTLAGLFPNGEKYLLEKLGNRNIGYETSLLLMNALTTLSLQKGDVETILAVAKTIETLPTFERLLPIFCASLASFAGVCNETALLQVLLRTASLIKDERERTELEWKMCSMCLSGTQVHLPLVLRGIIADKHYLLQGELTTLSRQFPLKGYNVARWNSVESGAAADPSAYINMESAIISVSRDAQCEATCRTVVGRHCWTVDGHETPRPTQTNVANWLRKEANRGRKSGRESMGILGAMDDPFDELPETRATCTDDVVPSSSHWTNLINLSRRQPQPLFTSLSTSPTEDATAFRPPSRLLEWRSFSASAGFVPNVCQVSPNFARDLKHLDQTNSREVHKVAVIYVADGQDEKNAILNNCEASNEFDDFVAELGWEVMIGRGHEGYVGGLPVDTRAPYYADADTEVVFHVSTWLGKDTNKWKHIGNDEVHVVWNDNKRKPYTRETIATKFCDVLIVIESIGDKMARVRIDKAHKNGFDFGPLFDGAVVGLAELAPLVRLTVINASRKYRLMRTEHARPLRHREEVFCNEAAARMQPIALSTAINQLYVPSI